jgi:phage tail-like protein
MDVHEIERLLPWIFQRTLDNPDNPLRGLLAVMSGLHVPAEEVLRQLNIYFDPYTTPEIFLPFLAQMMNLDNYLTRDPPYLLTGTQNLRNLIALAVSLSKQRGTSDGLRQFLEVAVGIGGFRVADRARPFHITVIVPSQALPYLDLIERIIAGEKPAYVTYELAQEQLRNG